MKSCPLRRLLLLAVVCAWPLFPQGGPLRTAFRVKYVAQGIVYLDGGRDAGLAEKMKMTVRRSAALAPAKPQIPSPNSR